MQQGHLGTAQGQAVAKVITVFAQRQAQLPQLVVEGIGRHHHQRAHGRHIERRGQRRAHRHPALELAVVVLRDVQAAGRGDLGRRVIHQRSRREPLLGNRLRVQKRLERGAWLARGQHAIDLTGLTQCA